MHSFPLGKIFNVRTKASRLLAEQECSLRKGDCLNFSDQTQFFLSQPTQNTLQIKPYVFSLANSKYANKEIVQSLNPPRVPSKLLNLPFQASLSSTRITVRITKIPQHVQRLKAEKKKKKVSGIGMTLPVRHASISCFLLKEQAV